MKIDLSKVDKTNFSIAEKELNGEKLFLITPSKEGTEWNKDNLIFRSSIWNEAGELVSAGFPKFFNLGEKESINPAPVDLSGAFITKKLDGSLLIVSKYKGQFILRTRGTFDASIHENGDELKEFKQKILPCLDENFFSRETWDHSYLFEWRSPNRTIVIKHIEVNFVLLGVIVHHDYSIEDRRNIEFMKSWYNVEIVPKIFVDSLPALLEANFQLQGEEGFVIYSSNGQILHKLKTPWYLVRHRLKSQLNSKKSILEFWEANGRPDRAGFLKIIKETFDFEVCSSIGEDINKVFEAIEYIQDCLKEVRRFVLLLNKDESRKKHAEMIKEHIGRNYVSFAFCFLDGKRIEEINYTKLVLENLTTLEAFN